MKQWAVVPVFLNWVKAGASMKEIWGRRDTRTLQRRLYRVTPRANPRVFRRELLYAAMLQLKQTQDGS
jgi:hypothetical protein